jgi:peptide/nickel transport system substrate-binding protein
MNKFKAFAAVVATVALAMGTVSASNAAGSTLKLGAAGFPASYAADQAEAGNKVWYYQAVYDTLLNKNSDGTMVPNVATKWSYSSDRKVITLDIRSGIKFTDGATLDAAAVVKNLVANRDSKGPSFKYLKTLKSAVAKGANQVVLTLTEADIANSFLNYLGDSTGFLASPKAIGKASSATTPVGSGPYILDKAKTKSTSKYVYKANPNYWNKSARKYDNLQINVYSDTVAMANALKSGAVQGGNVFPTQYKTVKSAGYKFASQTLDVKGIFFSSRAGANKTCVSDVNVRRAINSVFDRAALLKSFGNAQGTPTTQYFPATNPGYSTTLDKKYPFDEKAGKAFMAKSAYPDGCTLNMATLVGFFAEAEYAVIKQQLAKLGITVKEEAGSFATFIDDLQAPKYDAYLMYFERSTNPWVLLNFMVANPGIFNNDKYEEAKVTKLINDYKTASEAKRKTILKDINTELVNNAWFAPWFAVQSNFAYKGITAKPQAGNVIPYLYNIK